MTNVPYVIHDNNGRIIRSGVAPEHLVHLQANAGEFFLVGEGYQSQHYINNGIVTPRPTFDLNNVPPSTEVYVDNQMVGVVDDGIFEFTCPIPGQYSILLAPPFPFRRLEYVVNVE